MTRTNGWGRRLVAAVVAVTGLGWAIVSANRGRAAIVEFSSPAQVALSRLDFAWDACVDATINRLVPRHARVWADTRSSAYWSGAVGPMSQPYHQVVATPLKGAYAVAILPPVQGLPGTRCRGPRLPGSQNRNVPTMLVQVRKL